MVRLQQQLIISQSRVREHTERTVDAEMTAEGANKRANAAEQNAVQTYLDSHEQDRVRSKQRWLRQAPLLAEGTLSHALENNPLDGDDNQSTYTASTHSALRLHVGTVANSRVYAQNLCGNCFSGPGRYTCTN